MQKKPTKPQANIVKTAFGPKHIGHQPKAQRMESMKKMKTKYKTEMATRRTARKVGK